MAKKVDEKQRRKILTSSLWAVVFSITAPLFLYNFINSVYSLLDAIMLAYVSPVASSAGATLAQVKNLISSLASGLAAGGAIIVSRHYGAGEINEAKKSANVMFTMNLIIIALILGVMLPLAIPIMQICGCNEDIIAVSSNYFRLQLVEQVLIAVNSIFIALEKSKGNTRIILIGNLIMMAIKISLNAILVYALKVNDMTYIEIASIVSQLFMTVLGCYFLFRKSNVFRIEFKALSLKWDYVKKILVMSIPLFLGKFVISLGKVGVNAMCKVYGSLTVGALGVSNNISGLVTNPGTAFEDSESSIVSQNLGNGNMKRCLKTFFISCVMLFSWALIGFLIVRVFFLDQIVGLFANTDPDYASQIVEYQEMIKNIFYYDCLSIPALAIVSAVLGFLYGYGQTFLATINNLLRIATRIGTLWFLQTFTSLGSESAGISMGISNISIAILSLIMLSIFFIKTKIKGYKGMHFSDEEPEMHEINGILVRKKEKIFLKDQKSSCKNAYLEINNLYENKPCILIIPGGGYSHLSPREGTPVSNKFISLGYNTAILYYSLGPKYSYPVQKDEVNTALIYLSSKFKDLFIMGFSAGGHLAGIGGTDINSHLLKGMILCYPVINLESETHEGTRDNFLGKYKDDVTMQRSFSIDLRVNSSTPPTYIWTTLTDQSVPPSNTIRMEEALTKNNVYHKMKLYPRGPHGVALADETAIKDGDTSYVITEIQSWPNDVSEFIEEVLQNEAEEKKVTTTPLVQN